MAGWTGADILVGDGAGGFAPEDRAAEKAKRQKTLCAMGVKPLVAFSSPMMDKPVLTAAQIRARGRWPKPTPRQEARQRGDAYYVGAICKRGHEPAFRSVVNGSCLACTDLWENENREKMRAIWRESKRRCRDRKKAATV